MNLNVIKHLLPRGVAWNITANKRLRSFFDGLATAFCDFVEFFDGIWLDLLPESTRELAKWEVQFGLFAGPVDDAERRRRLDAAWKALGGQSPAYIQGVIQAAGFDVYIHEWWADSVPTARNPFDYLRGSSTDTLYVWECGTPGAECGEGVECGETSDPIGYPLVNLILETVKVSEILCGEPDAECGEPDAECGSFGGFKEVRREYIMPTDPDTFPHYLYFCGETFPDPASVPNSRRLEFERLLLKLCPTQNWIGVIVNYT